MFELKQIRAARQHESSSTHIERRKITPTLNRLDASDADPHWPISVSLHQQAGDPTFKLQVVNHSSVRNQAENLLRATYTRRGLWAPNDFEPFGRSDRTFPDTFTLLASDAQGLPAATIALLFDSATGLPCDTLFPEAFSNWRIARSEHGIAEVVHFAIADRYRNKRSLLTTLFNFLYLHAIHFRGIQYFTIEVHPSHVTFYERLLCFKKIDEARPCQRVGGAPAVLMALNLDTPAAEINALPTFKNGTSSKRNRTLYKHFLGSKASAEAVRFLASVNPLRMRDSN